MIVNGVKICVVGREGERKPGGSSFQKGEKKRLKQLLTFLPKRGGITEGVSGGQGGEKARSRPGDA